jgi:DNA/RNA endonuclease YhcR with UshA esterase domain
MKFLIIAAAATSAASYDGKTIDVTGTINLYHGSAEIVLDSPSQISAKWRTQMAISRPISTTLSGGSRRYSVI